MLARILYYYHRATQLKKRLRTPAQLAQHQRKLLSALVNKTLVHSPFYREFIDKPFDEWPIVNKQLMNQHFDTINTCGIKRKDALAIALQAEQSRDFSPLMGKIAVGLSSGTSGERGLFLTSPKERDAWAGVILAKVLPHGLRTKERIAFFLRANNPLYTTLNKSRRIQFHFFDLMGDFTAQIEQLNTLQPTILSAPASVLRLLAQEKQRLNINPKRIVAVAEVLEKADEAFISQAFGLAVTQIYQCCEGFLAVSDKTTNQLLMNDEFLIIEKEWIDEERFIPIVTDLMRTTQPIIRYRLDDVLISAKNNSVFTALDGIEGRLGDVCYGQQGDVLQPIFADSIRQCMASSPVSFTDYYICQTSLRDFTIQVFPALQEPNKLIDHLNTLFIQKGCEVPNWIWEPFETRDKANKLRRIQSRVSHFSGSVVPRTSRRTTENKGNL